MNGPYRQLLMPLAVLLVAALALRLAWELMAPVLLPLAIVGVVVVLALVAYRRR